MRTADEWFDAYSESHRNPVNKMLHWICVPLISYSLVGLLWSVHPYAAWALIAVALAFYAMLSLKLALGMVLGIGVIVLICNLVDQLFLTSLAIFVLAWVGQFIGHWVEGKKPSFFEDMQFLLVGPAWLLSFVYRRLGIEY